MPVASDMRRRGIGGLILQFLLDQATRENRQQVILETTGFAERQTVQRRVHARGGGGLFERLARRYEIACCPSRFVISGSPSSTANSAKRGCLHVALILRTQGSPPREKTPDVRQERIVLTTSVLRRSVPGCLRRHAGDAALRLRRITDVPRRRDVNAQRVGRPVGGLRRPGRAWSRVGQRR